MTRATDPLTPSTVPQRADLRTVGKTRYLIVRNPGSGSIRTIYKIRGKKLHKLFRYAEALKNVMYCDADACAPGGCHPWCAETRR